MRLFFMGIVLIITNNYYLYIANKKLTPLEFRTDAVNVRTYQFRTFFIVRISAHYSAYIQRDHMDAVH